MSENYVLPGASKEQQLAIDTFKYSNLVIDSVAGSGKTTTILHLAKTYPFKTFLLLTYNKYLKEENRRRCLSLGIRNMEAHTYHSFCVKYYSHSAFDDKGLLQVLKLDLKRLQMINFNMLVVDEAQDIRTDLFKLIMKIAKDNIKTFQQICVIGDERQTIYKFGSADERYMRHAERNFGDIPLCKIWNRVELKQSFRVPLEVCRFLNECMFGKCVLVSEKTTSKPAYMVCNAFGRDPFDYFLEIVKRNQYKPGEIFILAPSVRSVQSPSGVLQNRITEYNNDLRKAKRYSEILPVYTTADEDQSQSSEKSAMDGKIVVATFHKVKGLERRVVFLFGMDESCYNVFRDDSVESLPNPVYVGMTRALELLVVFSHCTSAAFKFMDPCFTKYVDYHEKVRRHIKTVDEKIVVTETMYAVTDVLKHVSPYVLDFALQHIVCTRICDVRSTIAIENTPRQENGLIEETADINGVALISFFEWKTTGRLSTHEKLTKGDFINSSDDVIKQFKKFPVPEFPADICGMNLFKLLYLSNYYCARSEGLSYRLDQITRHDWIPQKIFDACAERLSNVIKTAAIFEKNVQTQVYLGENQSEPVTVFGAVDCIDNDVLWEFKCVHTLKSDHFLQLAMYAYLWLSENPFSLRKYYLFNVLTNEHWEVTWKSFEYLEEMMKYLLRKRKSSKNEVKTDTEFEDLISTAKQTFLCPKRKMRPETPSQEEIIDITSPLKQVKKEVCSEN